MTTSSSLMNKSDAPADRRLDVGLLPQHAYSQHTYCGTLLEPAATIRCQVGLGKKHHVLDISTSLTLRPDTMLANLRFRGKINSDRHRPPPGDSGLNRDFTRGHALAGLVTHSNLPEAGADTDRLLGRIGVPSVETRELGQTSVARASTHRDSALTDSLWRPHRFSAHGGAKAPTAKPEKSGSNIYPTPASPTLAGL